jgi:nucleotide-binding universal stress UspA family protein
VFQLQGRPVLLAMDGTAGAAASARVALALATEHGAVVHVVHVIDTRAVPFPPALDVVLAVTDPERDHTTHQQQVQEMRELLSSATGQVVDWPIHVVLGTPANAILEAALDIGATLVVVGLRRHRYVDRALNNETALSIMRHSICPVLGIVPGTTSLPTRLLATTDFSAVSVNAVRVALAIAGARAKLTLAYVSPLNALLGEDGERLIHDLGVQSAFAQLVHELGERGVSFDHIALERLEPKSTASVILSYAEEANCDLVAAGSARHGRFERWILGSVSTDLVREASRSVLIVPPPRQGL